jgi:hypothetical protein
MGRHTKPHTGRPYVPSDEQRRSVLSMTGYGIKHEDIATMLRIDKKTLYRHFRRELDTGMTEANVRVAQALYGNATKNMNVTAQIWWTKTRMGWKAPDEQPAHGGNIVIITGVRRDLGHDTTQVITTGVHRGALNGSGE